MIFFVLGEGGGYDVMFWFILIVCIVSFVIWCVVLTFLIFMGF